MEAEPTRALVVVPTGERLGGAEQMLWQYVRHHDPDAVALHVVFLEPGAFVDEVRSSGIPTSVVPAGRLRNIGRASSAVRRLSAIIREANAEVVVSWMGRAHLVVAPAARLSGIKPRSLWWQHSITERPLIDRVTTALPASAIGSSSQAVAAAQAGLRPRRPMFVVHPGIDLERWSHGDRNRASTRAQLGLADDDIAVGMVARFQRWKGQHRFVEAIAAARGGGANVVGVLVGDAVHGIEPEYPAFVRSRAEALGVTDALRMVGHVDDAERYLGAVDIAVNCSEREALGIAVQEAMAAGLATIAVADGGCAELIDHEVDGLLLTAPHAAELAAAIGRLADDSDLRARLGQAAKQRARDRFGAPRMAADMDMALRDIASGRLAPFQPTARSRIAAS